MVKEIVEVGPKLYLNGFPKSGTHLLETMAVPVLAPANRKQNWMGNVDGKAFGTTLVHLDDMVELAEVFPMQRYVKGHVAWTKEIAQALRDNQWCMAFIFRDFRDVAVSAAYHAKKETKQPNFPEKEKYQAMEFDELLRRIITGDDVIAGVMKRWEMYAPWLDEDWVLKLAYDDVIENKEEAAEWFIWYLLKQTADYMRFNAELDPDTFNKLMHRVMYRLDHPELSPTYRKGKRGGWREHFTDEHKALFKASDTNNWLIRLGYENDRNW